MFRIGDEVINANDFINYNSQVTKTVEKLDGEYLIINSQYGQERYHADNLILLSRLHSIKVGDDILTEDLVPRKVVKVHANQIYWSDNYSTDYSGILLVKSKEYKKINAIKNKNAKQFALMAYFKSMPRIKELLIRSISDEKRIRTLKLDFLNYQANIKDLDERIAELKGINFKNSKNQEAFNNLLLDKKHYENFLKNLEKSIARIPLDEKIISDELEKVNLTTVIAKAQSQYDSIMRHKSVESAIFEGNKLIVTTKDLFYNNYRSRFFNLPLGAFKIMVSGTSNPLAINYKYHVMKDKFHPCLEGQGNICMGEAFQSTMSHYLHNYEFDMAIYAIINFIEEPNYGHPYIPIDKFVNYRQPVTMKVEKEIDWFNSSYWRAHEKWDNDLYTALNNQSLPPLETPQEKIETDLPGDEFIKIKGKKVNVTLKTRIEGCIRNGSLPRQPDTAVEPNIFDDLVDEDEERVDEDW